MSDKFERTGYTAAEEKVLSENGKVDPAKLQALIFDQFQNGYYVSKAALTFREHPDIF